MPLKIGTWEMELMMMMQSHRSTASDSLSSGAQTDLGRTIASSRAKIATIRDPFHVKIVLKKMIQLETRQIWNEFSVSETKL